MRNLILNKNITVPFLFFILLTFKGGDFASTVMENSNLAAWLEANKLNITFSGSDFSILPAIAVIAGILFVSQALFLVIEAAFAVLDALNSAPGNVAEKNNYSAPDHSASKEKDSVTAPSQEKRESEKQ